MDIKIDLNLKLEFINEDILKFTQNNLQREFDFVIHAAATAPLPDNEINPSKSYENNVVNTIRFAEYCTNIGCKNLIFLVQVRFMRMIRFSHQLNLLIIKQN